MSFLQPMLVAAFLPVVALPVIIHLINQRRYQSVRWAAMMFLLAANRMSRGYARLRQWLILAFRVLAVAGLVFAIGRPLAGGWLGLTAGGGPDTTIIVLDRSPSMQQIGAGGESKLETGRRQLVRAFRTLGSSHWVLIEGGANKPRELESPDALRSAPGAEPTSASADVPGMLQAAHDYVRANKVGQAEVWICSDLRENDWSAESGRWKAIRESFLGVAGGVRFHLLAYAQPARDNVSVRVTDVRRRDVGDAAELLISVLVRREGGEPGKPQGDETRTIPVQIEIEGARSEVPIELNGPQYELKDHRIPLERGRERGWGKVSIPADVNPADNDSWFVFDRPVPRKTIIVADDDAAARALELAASIPPDPALRCTAEVVGPDQLGAVDWESVGLVLWQAALPDGEGAKSLQAFVERGGRLICFPPRRPGGSEFLGAHWTNWVESAKDAGVENWRGDQDLLAHTQSGTALPVGSLAIRRACGVAGEVTPLATLRGGAPLLARLATNRGGVYFCATTPAASDSSLATDGVVLYVLVQRALAAGAEMLGHTRQLTAGEPVGEDPTRWKRIAGWAEALSSEYPQYRGVYQSGDRLLAVNRSAGEDSARVLADGRVAELFRGLPFRRVDDRAGSLGTIVQEIWRLFLAAMMVALVVEAGLCMPRPARPAGGLS